MIAVTMGYYGKIYRAPGIDVEFSGDTVNAFIRELYEFQNAE